MHLQRLGMAHAIVLSAAAVSQLSLAQVAPPVILQIDAQNVVQYFEDTPDVSKFATDPSVTTPVLPKNFNAALVLGDIVEVNGQPAMGTITRNARSLFLTTAPTPGLAIADTVRNAVTAFTFEILKTDGTAIGTIVASGFSGGSPSPGVPSSVAGTNMAIVGGAGAFLGVRGQLGKGVLPGGLAVRSASITEDPANRRHNGGGGERWVLQLLPASYPQIVTTSGGPAVTHSSDFSLVTASKPAAVGEILSLFATGLGPVRPGVDPGQPFPSSPLAVVNSPVNVTVNGKAAEVIGAVGYPGAVDGFQVNFRVPSDAAKGPGAVQVSVAWIAGPPLSIIIQ